ncbi:TPA: hypothetical protein HA244_00215 [Candidatus Micrarchaeota archaeon]|nr:hypothetical protein [Candidatus Micrarchaeota archaeon]
MNATIFLGFLGLMLLLSPVVFAEAVRYDFDDVEVLYAAEFTAKPVSVSADNWLVELAGGTDKNLTVLYGVVNLKKDGRILVSEEYAKIGGEGGSVRLLVNSAQYEYYSEAPDAQLKFVKSQFWTAKKLNFEGENLITVVKDFTAPIKSVVIYRSFDENGQVSGFVIDSKVANDLSSIVDSFSTQEPPNENYYKVDGGDFRQAGDSEASTAVLRG